MVDKLIHLLELLDDPDQQIFFQVKEEVLRMGPSVLVDLENFFPAGYSPLFYERLQKLIDIIRFNQLLTEWREWLQIDKNNLQKGISLFNRTINPDTSESELENSLKPLIREIWLELHDRLTGIEKIRVLNYVLFEKNNFSTDNKPLSPSFTYSLQNLLNKRTGNFISLSSLFLLLCRKLNLPVYGLVTGDLFLLAYLENPAVIIVPVEINTQKVLFYINVAQSGLIIGNSQLRSLLSESFTGDQPPQAFLIPDHITIKILLQNLNSALSKEGKKKRLDNLNEIISLWND